MYPFDMKIVQLILFSEFENICSQNNRFLHLLCTVGCAKMYSYRYLTLYNFQLIQVKRFFFAEKLEMDVSKQYVLCVATWIAKSFFIF